VPSSHGTSSAAPASGTSTPGLRTRSGVELVKTTGTEAYETERIEDASWRYFRDTMGVLRLSYIYRPGMELLAGLSFAVTFIVGGLWVFTGEAPFMLTEPSKLVSSSRFCS